MKVLKCMTISEYYVKCPKFKDSISRTNVRIHCIRKSKPCPHLLLYSVAYGACCITCYYPKEYVKEKNDKP